MNKVNSQSFEIQGHNNEPIPIDIQYNDQKDLKDIVIFVHGYKGFKDFGAWEMIGEQFSQESFVFVRFNFSHNGMREDPMEFTRLDLFEKNTFSVEVDEIHQVIDFIYGLAVHNPSWNERNISLIGHSRGGGMSIIAASENKKVNALISWASIKDVFDMQPKGQDLEKWKEEGVRYVINGRTKQKMPHLFTYYQDCLDNKERLNIGEAAKNITAKWLIVHGDNDEAVTLSAAHYLKDHNKNSELLVIKNGGHTFSISHPWKKNDLPLEMQTVVNESIRFLKGSSS